MPVEVAPGRVHAEVGELGDGAGHQALAAGLVDRSAARLAHDDGQPGAVRVQRGREAHGSAAGDDEVMHRRALGDAAAAWRARRPRSGCGPRAGRR